MADALLVTSSFLPGRGGIESYLAELCAAVQPRMAVFAQASRDGKPLPTDLGYETFGYDGPLVAPTARVRNAIVETASRAHTNRLVFGTPWPLGLLGPSLKKRGLEYAAIVHGSEVLVPGAVPVIGKKLARALARAELLLPVSDFTASKIRELLARYGFAIPRMERLYARVDTDRFVPNDNARAKTRSEWGVDPDAWVVLCFGRLVRRKGIHRLIDAWPRISGRVPGAILTIAGTGPVEKALRRRAIGRGVPARFLGKVPWEDAPAIYAAADVFALPVVDRWRGLDTEGLGVVLLEAAATGKPSITGRSGGTSEAVVDGVTGFVIDAADRNQLVSSITRLLSDRDLAEQMGKEGRRHVAAFFASSDPPKALLEWLG